MNHRESPFLRAMNLLRRGATDLVQYSTFVYGGANIGAKALLYINLTRFGFIARLSQWGGRGHFTRSNDFYLRSLRGGGGGGNHPGLVFLL